MSAQTLLSPARSISVSLRRRLQHGTGIACMLLMITGCGGGSTGSSISPVTPSAGCTAVPPAPSAPTAASVTATTLTLDWTAVAPTGCTLSYTVREDGSSIGTNLSGTSLAVSGLTANTTHTFTVTATDIAGTSTESAGLTVTTANIGTILNGITITGRLIWHTYDSYGFTGVQSWMANFDTGTVSEITPTRLAGAMNYHFSPDGQTVVVMADDADQTAKTGNQAWDIFVASVTDTGLTNLTKLTQGQVDGSRNEDPKFSADGTRIIFKHNLDDIVSFDVATIAVNGIDQLPAQTLLLHSPTEVSMPYFLSGTVQSFLYADSATNAIWLDNGGVTQSLYAVGTHAYYPIALDATRFYFVAGNSNDWIYRGDVTGSAAVSAGFITAANSTAEFADPSPINSDWLVFTSTVPGGSGSYDLWIGNFTTGTAYNLNGWIRGANHTNSDLGPTFHGTLTAP